MPPFKESGRKYLAKAKSEPKTKRQEPFSPVDGFSAWGGEVKWMSPHMAEGGGVGGVTGVGALVPRDPQLTPSILVVASFATSL